MNRFNVRIELHGDPDSGVYEQLHEKMAAASYSRTVAVNDVGTPRYHLPPAEYVAHADWSCTQIRDEVWEIAKSVWSDPAVYVSIVTARCWAGLEEA